MLTRGRRPGRRKLARRLMAGFFGLAVLGLGVLVFQAQAWARERLPAYVAAQLGSAMGRRVSVGSVSFWPPGAFTIEQVRVEPIQGDPGPPLVAPRLRAYVSWWDLLAHRRLRVPEIHLDDARIRAVVDVSDPKLKRDPATELLALRKVGLSTIGLHDAHADVTTLSGKGEQTRMRTTGLDLLVKLYDEDFRYRVAADTWRGAGFSARDILLAGTGRKGSVTVSRSRAQVEGGRLEATGTYGTKKGDAAVRMVVQDMPLQRLAPEVGFPREWGVAGTLTGTVDVAALSGTLERVRGQVRIAAGSIRRSSAVFPWKSASAEVDWTPEGAGLRGVRIEGDGILLTGMANVGGRPGMELTRRPFTADAVVDASETKSVAALARLLAFTMPVEGSWDVGHGRVSFRARGTVGALEKARAAGRFSATDLMVRPRPNDPPLHIRTVEGALERQKDHLYLSDVHAAADGMTARADLTFVPPIGGEPGSYSTMGEVALVNLAVLRSQLPDATFWKFISAGPASRGTVKFAADGWTDSVRTARADATFRLREFEAKVPAGPGSPEWPFAVRTFTGAMRLRGDRLAVRDLTLRSDLFAGTGSAAVANVSGNSRLNGSMRLTSDRWTELPPLRDRVPRGLSGGTLTVVASVSGVPEGARMSEQPVDARLRLAGATYRLRAGARERIVQLEDSTATLEMHDGRVVVPEYRIVTARFTTSGSATARRAGEEWNVRAAGTLASNDVGALSEWWAGKPVVSGGKATARYVVQGPARPEALKVTADVRLADAAPVLPESALPFDRADTRIVDLTGRFTAQGGALAFDDVVLRAPRFRGAAEGTYREGNLAASVRLTTSHWREIAGELAKALPVSGGALTLNGTVQGPAERFGELPFQGSLKLRGATLATDRNASVPVEGGRLDLTAEAKGTLSRVAASEIDGSFVASGLPLPRLKKSSRPMVIERASGRFRRAGDEITLTQLQAAAPGLNLAGNGELTGVARGKAAHRFHFTALGPALAGILPALLPVPGKAEGGRFEGSMDVRGTAAEPVARLDARAQVTGGSWTPPGQSQPIRVHRMSGRFERRGSEAAIRDVEVRVQGGEADLSGTVSGLDTKAGPRHTLQVSWRLEDASSWAARLFPIPGKFTGGLFTGQAKIEGTPAAPAAEASGRFVLADTGFLPPKRVLHGPARPIQVKHARGLFTRSGRVTTLSDLDLLSSLGTATGRVVSRDPGIAEIDARVEVARLDDLVDLWPGFKERIAGGKAEMTVDLRGPIKQPSRLAGGIRVVAQGGTLTLEDVAELYARQPFDKFVAKMELPGNGEVRLERVAMSGPKANFEGSGLVSATGKVTAKGKAWFTKDFTKKLVKPRILYPVAKLFGYGRLKSDFTVKGTLRRAYLDMSITRKRVWKLAIRKKVPEPLRRIATGDAPLWSDDMPRSASR